MIEVLVFCMFQVLLLLLLSFFFKFRNYSKKSSLEHLKANLLKCLFDFFSTFILNEAELFVHFEQVPLGFDGEK